MSLILLVGIETLVSGKKFLSVLIHIDLKKIPAHHLKKARNGSFQTTNVRILVKASFKEENLKYFLLASVGSRCSKSK